MSLESFKKPLERLINEHGIDSLMGLPDYQVAETLSDCIFQEGNKSKFCIGFTLKSNSLESIKDMVDNAISKELIDPNAECVHGFLPRFIVESKGFDTSLVDFLDSRFPSQRHFFDPSKQANKWRSEMASFLKENNVIVYFFGNVTDGALDEQNLYEKAGIKCVLLKTKLTEVI